LNSRANRHCRNHRYHDWHEAEFWDYSFEKMGELDLPAGIDFILNKTKQEQLTYIGHSQGSTSLFAGMCLKPHYFKDKIKLFIAIAPVIRMTNVRSQAIKTANNFVVKKLIDACGPEI
jgi:pimeloyl-ACP methyl ester carboxylesterase